MDVLHHYKFYYSVNGIDKTTVITASDDFHSIEHFTECMIRANIELDTVQIDDVIQID